MELDRIELLLEKYFEAETSVAEENELKSYFATADVAQHLEQYKPMFGFFSSEKEQTTRHVMAISRPERKRAWLSLAASIVVLLGIGTFTYFNYNNTQSQDLGTYDDPEIAFRETQKALSLLSNNVNVGVKSVQYIGEYETAKSKVFNHQ